MKTRERNFKCARCAILVSEHYTFATTYPLCMACGSSNLTRSNKMKFRDVLLKGFVYEDGWPPSGKIVIWRHPQGGGYHEGHLNIKVPFLERAAYITESEFDEAWSKTNGAHSMRDLGDILKSKIFGDKK